MRSTPTVFDTPISCTEAASRPDRAHAAATRARTRATNSAIDGSSLIAPGGPGAARGRQPRPVIRLLAAPQERRDVEVLELGGADVGRSGLGWRSGDLPCGGLTRLRLGRARRPLFRIRPGLAVALGARCLRCTGDRRARLRCRSRGSGVGGALL